jgi:hypothetical protein
MVQQMIQNDPNVPPHLRQSIQQLSQNPAMLQQVSQMMQDPNMRAQMQTMMGNQAGGGMPPNFGGNNPGGFGAGTAPTGQANPNSNNNRPAANDEDQTEDEMIAEAIRRSLEES